jgi:plastocyanin
MKNRIFILSLLLLCVLTSFGFAGNIVGKVHAKGVKNSADAVIYIDKIGTKTFAPPKEHALVNQKNLKFTPHVLPVIVGTTVDFLNSDDVLHNVFSPDQCVEKMNLGTWPKGEKRSYTFKNPGCASVMLCNVHPEMEAYIMTVETPYYAVSAADGSYEIKNVPAGKYTLKIWHEKLKPQTVQVDVPEKGNATADFEIHK